MLIDALAALPARTVIGAMVISGLAALVGMALARAGRYRAHAVCQTTAFVLTLGLVAGWMVPMFRDVYASDLAGRVVNAATVAVAVHAILGATVVLLGVWIILVAGTGLVPAPLRFTRYRAWMRTLLTAWWLTIALGVLTYWLARR